MTRSTARAGGRPDRGDVVRVVDGGQDVQGRELGGMHGTVTTVLPGGLTWVFLTSWQQDVAFWPSALTVEQRAAGEVAA